MIATSIVNLLMSLSGHLQFVQSYVSMSTPTGNAVKLGFHFLITVLQHLDHNLLQLTPVYPKALSWGLCFFIIYLLLLGNIFRKYNIQFHHYVDDTQLYFSSEPTATLPLTSISDRLSKIKVCFTHNFHKTAKRFSLFIINSVVTPSPQVNSFGAILDSTLSFTTITLLIFIFAILVAFILQLLQTVPPYLSILLSHLVDVIIILFCTAFLINLSINCCYFRIQLLVLYPEPEDLWLNNSMLSVFI